MVTEATTFQLRQYRVELADLDYQRMTIEQSDDRAYSNGRIASIDEDITACRRKIDAWYAAHPLEIADDNGKLSITAARTNGFDCHYVDLRRPGVFKAVEFHLSLSDAEGICDYFGGRRVFMGSNYVDAVSAFTTVSGKLTVCQSEVARLNKRIEQLETELKEARDAASIASEELAARYSDAND